VEINASVRSSERLVDRRAAARDCWPLGTLRMWQGEELPVPARVFWPKDEAEVHAVLEAATAQGVPVVPFGAGSGVCGGAAGRPGAWVLDTKELSRLGPIDEARWTVRVGAGVNGQHLEDWLAARGWALGHSPSSIGCSTVGGWAAARSAGQFSSKYGVFEDLVVGLVAVAPGRGPFRLGPDGDAPAEWLELILGSEGTLAVVTELELRVVPAPQARWLRGYHLPDVASAAGVMRELAQGELHPSVVRLYDPVDTRIGGKTKPKKHTEEGAPRARSLLRRWLSRVDKLPEVHRRTLALPLALPGFINRVFEGVSSGCLLVVGFEGDPEVVRACSEAGHALVQRAGRDLGPEPGERWYASRHAVSYKLMPVFERGGFADTMEIACRWSDLTATYHSVRAALGRHTVVMAHMSHIYPEGACTYFSFAGQGDAATYAATWSDALAAALDCGATVTHHHGVGVLKAEVASREVGSAVKFWRRLKAELDPKGILNPGRLFVEVPWEDPGPLPPPRPEDALGVSSARAPVSERMDALWPFEALPGPARWHRCSWQTPWITVSSEVEGQRVLLGRGPRSACGPDLRQAALTEGAQVTYARAVSGPRWMGEGRPAQPWAVALALLRSDLRPAVLTVVDGALRVGFRGPAARALGALADARVPGGLVETPYAPVALPSGPLAPCAPDDPAAVAVTPHGVLRRA
jgi:alkyldihydroxyacetonephosphate synthase